MQFYRTIFVDGIPLSATLRTMIDKHLFRDAREFSDYVSYYCQDNDYETYIVEKPKSYPCVGLGRSERQGDYGTKYYLTDFVYLSDFQVDPS